MRDAARTYHGNTKQRKVQRLRNAEVHVRKQRRIITTPVTSLCAGAGKSGSADDEGSLAREDLEETVVGGVDDLVAEEVVHVIFLHAGLMRGVGDDGMHAQRSVDVVDHVWRVVHVSRVGRDGRGEVGHRCSHRWGCFGVGGSLRGGEGSGNAGLGGVCEIEALGISVDDTARFARKSEWWVHRVEGEVAGTTAANAEGRSLAHVNPDAAPRDLVVMHLQLVGPPLSCVRGVPVGEHSVARPHIANVLCAIRVVKPNIEIMASVVHRVGVAGIVGVRDIERRIDDWHVMLIVGSEARKERFSFGVRVPDRIVLEVSVLEHPIDVSPDRLEGNVEFAVVVDNSLDFAPVGVAPSALMEAECPVLLHGRQTNSLAQILLRHTRWLGAVKEVEINVAAERSPCDVGGKHQGLHAVCVALIDAMAVAFVGFGRGDVLGGDEGSVAGGVVDRVVASVEVEGVIAVDVPVDWVTGVGSPEGRGEVVAKSEAVNSLALMTLHQLCVFK